MSRSRLAGKAIYFVTRAKILEEASSIGNSATCSRFCANPDIAITPLRSNRSEEELSGRERDSVERRRAVVHTREGGPGTKERRKSLRRIAKETNEIAAAATPFDCGWSLLCHGTAEKMGGVTSGCAKPHLLEGS